MPNDWEYSYRVAVRVRFWFWQTTEMMTKSLDQIVATIDQYYWSPGRKVQLHGVFFRNCHQNGPFIYGWIILQVGGMTDLSCGGLLGGEMGRGESPWSSGYTSPLITTLVPRIHLPPRAVPWEPIISSLFFTLWSLIVITIPYTQHTSWTYFLWKYVVMRVISRTFVLKEK